MLGDAAHVIIRQRRWVLLSLLAIVLAACSGGEANGPNSLLVQDDAAGAESAVRHEARLASNPNMATPTGDDSDGDGLTNAQEALLGTNANNVDSDGDRIWDGEEVTMFGTDALAADSDGDGINDGADPQPTVNNRTPRDPGSRRRVEYGVFIDNETGTARRRITDTRFEINHVVYAPHAAPGAPFLIYQTYLRDTNRDTVFTEGEAGNMMFIIKSGKVQVIRGEAILAELGENEFFGEMALVSNEPRNATIKTTTDVELFTLNKADFDLLISTKSSIATMVSYEVVKRSQH